MCAQKNSWDKFWQQRTRSQATRLSWSKIRILRIVDAYLKKNQKILDAGCGSGFFSKYFYDKGLDVTALDYSDEALGMTRQVVGEGVKFRKEDLKDPELALKIPDRFDVIFSDGLLEHFSAVDQDKILKNFYNLLTAQGVLITFVPNLFSPWQIIRPFMMPGISESPLISSTFDSVIRRNNFKIIENGGINVFPWRVSPEKFLGRYFGMLLYSISNKNA